MGKKADKLDELHIKYEELLKREIESLLGLAYIHGWKSQLVVEGVLIRQKLREAGSKIPPEKQI